MSDTQYMQLALELAKKGCGQVNPNPMVGAVIVKNGAVIGQGWHQQYGGLHAERIALAACKEPPQGATLYVTLEPCCHWGQTPPCTEAIIQSGIGRVVVGSPDPNPLVAGKGVLQLRQAGIQVTEHVLEWECTALNTVFFHYIQTNTPYVVMKYAMTMDGKIATYTGDSQWITGEAARRRVHEDRNRYSAIMVGVGTVLSDNPLLTCRLPGGRNPIRIVCDSRLRTPLNSRLVETAPTVPTILATCCQDQSKQQPYEETGCRILVVPEKDGRVDLSRLMSQLAQQKIDSILLEGGAALNWSALQSGVVQKVQTYLAPKLFGGNAAPSPVGGAGVAKPAQGFLLETMEITRLETDILIESKVKPLCLQESLKK